MNPDFNPERARFNMVEQQIRPWEVLDQSVLDLLFMVRREDYVPEQFRGVAFADVEVPLRVDGVDTGRLMLAPRVEARLLQELKLGPSDNVLEIGTGSGYMAALLAHKARQVTTVEIDPRLAAFASANLTRNGVHNVRVELGDGARGWPARAPYNAIVVSGGLPMLPAELLAQLSVGGRLAAIVGTGPVMQALLVTRVSESQYDRLPLFETWAAELDHAPQPERFKF